MILHEEELEDAPMQPRWLSMPTSFIDTEIVEETLAKYDQNNLFQYISCQFGPQNAYDVFNTYRVGTSGYWPGATVLWQIDRDQRVRTGIVKLFDPQTGKQELHSPYKPVPAHILFKLFQFNAKRCLFGEHQLPYQPDKTVAIVSNEATALIATLMYSEYVWLASGGGMSELELHQCEALKGRNIVLYPSLSKDGSTFRKWSNRAMEFQKYLNCQVSVSSFLEDNAAIEDKLAGVDIAHFITRGHEPVHDLSVTLEELGPYMEEEQDTMECDQNSGEQVCYSSGPWDHKLL